MAAVPAQPLQAWEEFRRLMPVARQYAYLDHAAVAPLPEPTRVALAAWADDVAAHGDAHWPQWAERLERVRRTAATMIGADPLEVALVRNTTEGINFVAEGFPWQAGDNLVTLADEFPSNLYPWMHLASRGVETRRVPVDDGHVDLDRLAAACDRRTRLIAVSWVGYASGWRSDLDALVALARERGAYLFVDAIQALGVFPLDVRCTPIDFLAADGHKWLLGPEGAGLFYLRREHLDLLRPVGIGWNSVVSRDFNQIELTFKPSAGRYEGGTYNVGGLVALGASLDLLASYGTEALAARVLEIADLARHRLVESGATIFGPADGPHTSGIVAFEWRGANAIAVRKRLLAAGVILSARVGRLRASLHAYNNADDVERLVAALKDEG